MCPEICLWMQVPLYLLHCSRSGGELPVWIQSTCPEYARYVRAISAIVSSHPPKHCQPIWGARAWAWGWVPLFYQWLQNYSWYSSFLRHYIAIATMYCLIQDNTISLQTMRQPLLHWMWRLRMANCLISSTNFMRRWEKDALALCTESLRRTRAQGEPPRSLSA